MKNKVLVILLTLAMAISMAACGSKTSETANRGVESEEAKEKEAVEDTKSEEVFKDQYALIIDAIYSLNVNSDYVGEYVMYVREFYNDESMDGLICDAYGVSPFNGADKREAYGYAEQYVNSLAEIDTIMAEIDEMYKDINSTYGNDYNISDLKEYYLESSAYAEFVKELDGSYLTYCQTINSYQDNLAKLKKAAEIAY